MLQGLMPKDVEQAHIEQAKLKENIKALNRTAITPAELAKRIEAIEKYLKLDE